MCSPLMITAGLSAVQYIGGKAAAENQYKATEKSTLLGYEQVHEKQEQLQDRTALEQSERIKQGMIERAKIATIAGESNALGFSADRLIGDSFMQQGTDLSSIERNGQGDVMQAQMQARQIQGRGQVENSQIASRGPTLLGTGLQIAGEAYTLNKAAKNISRNQI